MFITDATHLFHVMNCNGSRLLPNHERPAEDNTTLRDEGNAAHWLAQEAFEGRIDINAVRDDLRANNNVLVTVFMFEHVREYLLNLYPGQMESVTSWGIEGVFQINGRADHVGYDREADELYIDDFKYGYSIVEPELNWTLISHAIGWMIMWNWTPARIRFRIHQPRPYHPNGHMREWVISGEQLRELHAQVTQVMTYPDDILRTGPYCGKCSKLGKCPAARNANMNAVDIQMHAYSDQLDNDQLADELRTVDHGLKMLKKRHEALTDMGKHRVQHGHVLPGHQLERTFSNTTWHKHLTPAMVKVMTGRELAVPKLCTPPEAKARGVPELLLNTMTTRIESGVKLVAVDINKRVKDMINEG